MHHDDDDGDLWFVQVKKRFLQEQARAGHKRSPAPDYSFVGSPCMYLDRIEVFVLSINQGMHFTINMNYDGTDHARVGIKLARCNKAERS